MTWETGLATAGTWSAVPTRAQLYGAGVPLPGTVIQVQRNETGAVASNATTIPADDTIPQNTEGSQYMSQAITPTSAAHLIEATHVGAYFVSTTTILTMALFQDAAASALAAMFDSTTANGNISASLIHSMLAGTTAATTLKIRAAGASGTTTFNGAAAARLYGGVMASSLELVERAT
jgi:hypothetical protein